MERLRACIHEGLKRWGMIQADFNDKAAMTNFLKRTRLVVMIDHNQLDIEQASTLDKASGKKQAEMTADEARAESAWRALMDCYRSKAVVVQVEARFTSLKIELIQRLKQHTLIKDINLSSAASIRVIIA